MTVSANEEKIVEKKGWKMWKTRVEEWDVCPRGKRKG